MHWATVIGGLIGAVSLGGILNGQTESVPAQTAPACPLQDRFFEDEVWAKVGERTCLRCHNSNGDAADSALVLSPRTAARGHDVNWIQQNCEAFQKMARARGGDQSRLLLKATGGLRVTLSSDEPDSESSLTILDQWLALPILISDFQPHSREAGS